MALWRRSVQGVGNPLSWEKVQSVTSLCECVCLCFCVWEWRQDGTGGRAEQTGASRERPVVLSPALCALVTRWALISIVIGLFVCRWVMACPAPGPERQGEPPLVSRADLVILVGAVGGHLSRLWPHHACPLLKRQHGSCLRKIFALPLKLPWKYILGWSTVPKTSDVSLYFAQIDDK